MADADWKKYRRLRGRDLPASLPLPFGDYALESLLKHDFYAATAIYRRAAEQPAAAATAGPERVIYKEYHTAPLGWLPLGWLGRFLCRRETALHGRVAHVPGVPRVLCRVGAAGFAREFHPGCNLRQLFDAGGRPDGGFFPKLEETLRAVHAAGVSHNDLSKMENVLVTSDGEPVLIDFQIATCPALWPLGLGWLAGPALRYMQGMDLYHLRKQHRRARPMDMTPELERLARRRGLLLNLHYYCIRNPYRAVRHALRDRFLKAPPEAGQERKAA